MPFSKPVHLPIISNGVFFPTALFSLPHDNFSNSSLSIVMLSAPKTMQTYLPEEGRKPVNSYGMQTLHSQGLLTLLCTQRQSLNNPAKYKTCPQFIASPFSSITLLTKDKSTIQSFFVNSLCSLCPVDVIQTFIS